VPLQLLPLPPATLFAGAGIDHRNLRGQLQIDQEIDMSIYLVQQGSLFAVYDANMNGTLLA
jgi:hypothetical protein